MVGVGLSDNEAPMTVDRQFASHKEKSASKFRIILLFPKHITGALPERDVISVFLSGTTSGIASVRIEVDNLCSVKMPDAIYPASRNQDLPPNTWPAGP